MCPAHYGRSFSAAKIAATTSLSRLGVRDGGGRLQRSGFQVHATSAGKRTKRNGTDAGPGNCFVLFLGQSSSQKREPEDHQQTAYDNHTYAQLLTHKNTFIQD